MTNAAKHIEASQLIWICKSIDGNLRQNICRHFNILAKFLFTTSETKLDYYHQKVNVQIASRVAERRKTWDLRKLGNFKEITETL